MTAMRFLMKVYATSGSKKKGVSCDCGIFIKIYCDKVATMKKMEKIRLPEGILVGHDTLEKTGVTVILAPSGAVGGVSVRGCAPGTRETDLMRAENSVEKVNAICLCGGSAFGLSACDGVVKYCHEKNYGHAVGAMSVPIVAGAVIYDLVHNEYNYPTAENGYSACKNAVASGVEFGNIGVGKGATIGKILGGDFSAKSGVGMATVSLGATFVTAITAVNAFGDVIDYKTGQVIKGVSDPSGRLLNTNNLILSGEIIKLLKGANTTISCIITNAKLTKLECNKLASIAHDGYAKTISPVHTDYDGDTIFALSKGEEQMDFLALSCMAVEAVCQSVVEAVTYDRD